MNFLRRTLKTGLVLMLSMALPAIAFAADDTTGGTTEITQDLIELVVMGIKGLNMILWPILIMIGDLLDTDLIMGPGMDERLKELWVQVRNLVNMAFVLVLLAIAFYNVLGIGGGEGNLALKTALPKLILGLVLVNFTLPIGRVLIDVTNVATHAAFGLPEVTGSFDFEEEQKKFAQRMCWKKWDTEKAKRVEWTSDNMDGFLYVQAFCAYTEEETAEGSEAAEEGEVKKKIYTGELNDFAKVNYFSDLNANNLGLIMAVNNQSLTEMMNFDENKITDWEDIGISLVFALVMYVIFAISYIALAILLFTRIIVLWAALVLSPVGVLVFVVPQIKEWMGGGGDIQQKIIKHLMAPVIVGLTYSLGYMLILAWDKDGRGNLSAADAQLGELMTADFLLSGINDLTDLMIAILSVVIIWTGVFAAADGTIAEKATGAIRDFGQQIGGALAKAPLTIPTVPIASSGDEAAPISPLAVAKLANQGLYQLETGLVQKQMDGLFQENKKLGDFFGYGGRRSSNPKEGVNQAENALKTIKSNQITKAELQNIAQGLMATINGSELKNKKDLVETLATISRSADFNPQKLQEFLKSNGSDINTAIKKSGAAGAGSLVSSLDRFKDNEKLKLKVELEDNGGESGDTDSTAGETAPPAKPSIDVNHKIGDLPDDEIADKKDREVKLTAFRKAAGEYDKETDPTKKAAALKKVEKELAAIKRFAEDETAEITVEGKTEKLNEDERAKLKDFHKKALAKLPKPTSN